MQDLLQVGGIANTHGVKGEVKVFPTTDDPNRFKNLKCVKMEIRDEYLDLEIEHVKFFKQFVILKFKGIDNINDVEKYKGKALFVTRENAVECEKGEYFIADIIGMTVKDEQNQTIGILKDVMKTGANDVYVITFEDGRELLLPAIRQCILQVNIEERWMQVHILEGLL